MLLEGMLSISVAVWCRNEKIRILTEKSKLRTSAEIIVSALVM